MNSTQNLRRLELARRDLESAESLLPSLESRGHIDGLQWGPIDEGLWTGIAVSYMRPFTAGLRVDESWEHFDDPKFQKIHDHLRTLRDTLFAHTDAASGREILLLPLGEEGRGFATESRPTFNFAAIAAHRELFEFQRLRMRARIDELVSELSSRGDWKLGDWDLENQPREGTP